jgi:hypothetical protein
MEEQQYSIERSIQEIHDILNHQQNGDLPEESVRLLKEELKLLEKYLAEMEEVRKNELKLAGLKEFIIPDEIKISRNEPKWHEPILLEPIRFEPIRFEPIRFEPIRFEPIRFEPKVLKPRQQKKSDGWKQANKNPRGPVRRY